MTNYCGLLVNILGNGECLKHLVDGQKLHIDYRPEITSVVKADFAESDYNLGSMTMINRFL